MHYHPNVKKPDGITWWMMNILRQLYKELPDKGVLPGNRDQVCELLEDRCNGRETGTNLLDAYLNVGLIVADVPKWKQPGVIPYQINPMYFHRGLLINVSDLERKTNDGLG